MGSIKLNKTIRSAIAHKIMAEKTKFKEQDSELRERSRKLAYDIYDHHMGDDMHVLQTARKGMFDTSQSIYVQCGGMKTHMYFYNENGERMYLPFPDDKNDGGCELSPTSRLGKRFQKLRNEQKDLSTEKSAVLSEINAVLNSCTTVGKLLEIWPESRKVVESCVVKTTSTALAVNMDKLNKKLALP